MNPGTESQNPRAYPYLIGILLVVAGIAVGTQVWRGKTAPAEEGEDIDTDQPTNWRGIAVLVALFVVHALLIDYIGWPLAAALLFGGTAVTLGARRWWAVVVASLALPIILLYVFTYGLSVYLPPGPLKVLMW
ncbi:putative tricarboxylic transport membrane protein [Goodfellowiella coeruleoviolacea]|uniref:Tricarboxylic transport membrane protein n=1 Tax=Goodfellowiella coeruleoviolacea TaxID=334858 RepID=A0AAE3KFE2_9PSEU|nr:putative tricarboxylic transport membrane protein [Goodfellowiella coeruleoviolacea]